MQEVKVNIKFMTPCLGSLRGPDTDRMVRDDEQRVIFLQTWWHKLLQYAAKAHNIDPAKVMLIRFDPVVDGTLVIHRRFYGPSSEQFKQHESFDKDQIISINAMLPDVLTPQQFQDLLQTGGRYVGISPYGHDKGYGRFSVVDVKSRNG